MTFDISLPPRRPNPEPLPQSVEAMVARKTAVTSAPLYVAVQQIHTELLHHPRYRVFLEAHADASSARGSLAADDRAATEMVRDYAVKHAVALVVGQTIEKLAETLEMVRIQTNGLHEDRSL